MTASAVEGDSEIIARGGDFAAADPDVALGEAASDMKSQGVINGRQVEDASVDHAGCAAVSLFGRLKGQANGAAQAVLVLIENLGDAQ